MMARRSDAAFFGLALKKWMPGWLVAVIAALIAGFTLGRRRVSHKQSAPVGTIGRAQEVSNEQAVAVENAGRELASNLSSSPAAKRAGILKWARKRGASRNIG